jgi:hypothetical protein
MQLQINPRGGYRFLAGIAAYSLGVVAMPGHAIVHVTLHRPLAYRDGFALIDRHLAAANRPRQALCAIQLRSQLPQSLAGFDAFNQGYHRLLGESDMLVEGSNPIARTNVVPEIEPPAEPSLYAFAYTVESDAVGGLPTFVVAGAGETRAGSLSLETVVRPGETSVDAMREKAMCVMQTMLERLSSLGVTAEQATVANVYTVRELQPYLADVILVALGPSAIHGVHWYYTRPPITGVEFEMDMRGVRQEMRDG